MPDVQDIQNVQTPEMAAWVQTIVAPMIQEQMEATRRNIRKDELGRLERTISEAQKRTDSRLDRLEAVVVELAEAQKRTEKRVEELAEAQKRTEKRVEELAEAQKRTEEQVAKLAATQLGMLERLDSLDHRVGLISNVLGIEAEGEAEEILAYILEQKGYRLLEAPYALAMDGEVDVVARAEAPDGEQVHVLVDVKARARLKELRRWSSRLNDPGFQQQLADAGVTKPFLPYFFGLRVYQVVDDEARRLGIGVLDPNGERVTPALLA